MIWALIPVKAFRVAKSRLAGALTPKQRSALARVMLSHTLDVLADVPEVDTRLVVSADATALALARAHGARGVRESGHGLNAALEEGRAVAVAGEADGLLVLPADLPALTVEDVRAVLALGTRAAVVLAPCRHGTGTNALYTRPPQALAYAFGVNSYAEHLAQAETSGLSVALCTRPNLALDLDTPPDLACWRDSADGAGVLNLYAALRAGPGALQSIFP